jgi:hypothetical protein
MHHLANAMKVVARQGGHIEIMPDGRIAIIPAGQAPAPEPNPWDEAPRAAD